MQQANDARRLRIADLLTPFEAFIRDTSFASILLVVCVVLALVIANSPLAEPFHALLATEAAFSIGEYGVEGSLHHWVNDGLMVLFFFLLGLEIKREMLVGELRDRRRAIPVVCAALGGMLMPAAIYLACNAGTATAHGWGVPMATDAAFALGVLALLGRRRVPGLAAFLTALAIIDDMGAVMVIAFAYTDDLSVRALGFGAVIFAVLLAMNAAGVRRPVYYLIGGLVLWLATLGSGVHTTTAGILAALAVPARPERVGRGIARRIRRLVNAYDALERRRAAGSSILADERQHAVLERLEETTEQASTPLQRWERALERPIALFVLPLFALMNAGVAIDREALLSVWSERAGIGIVLGLLLGKTAGIAGATWLALRWRLGTLPSDMEFRHVIGLAMLGGIGFTMSIFIAGLGFEPGSESLATAKIAILAASFVAAICGLSWLRFACSPRT